MNKIIEFTQDTAYDLVVNKNRNLNATLHCIYVEDGVEYDFNFQDYDTALMHVKKRSDDNTIILALSTIENTIELLPQGRIKFVADPEKMNVRAGEYVYDIYLYSTDYTKRQFMSGRFIIKSTVTN